MPSPICATYDVREIHNMKRRQLLTGLATSAIGSGLIAGTASAGIFSDAWDAAKGHVNDLIDRTTTDDAFAPGQAIRTGKFRETDPGQDAAHWVKGSVYLMEADVRYIQLGDDFKAGLAPDLYIYVSESKNSIVDEDTFFSTKQIELGKLIKGKGASFYEVPAGVDPKSVTIWCKQFSQFMGSANI